MTNKNVQKNKKNQVYIPLVLAITLIIGVFLGINLNFDSNRTKTDRKFFPGSFNNNNKINNILNYIHEFYVDSINRDYLEEQAIHSVLKNLDPHSSYIPESEFREINDPLMGSFEGIGIEFNMINDTVMVIAPIPGGPSEKVGLMSGDRIVKVNDKNIAGVNKSTDEIVRMLKGEKGTEVDVSVYRRGVDDFLEYTITRDEIPSHSLDIAYMLNNDIGYIKFSRFSATTHNEFINALKDLNQEEDMSKMILDLRGNGGGIMDAAINIADEFIEPGKLIVYTDGRRRDPSYAHARRNGAFESKPLIVLIDEWSASASEIIAGAIQDNDRGLVLGRRSFGKGLVQEQVKLGDGSALRLTTARYYTPTGRSIQKPYEDGAREDYFDNFIDRLIENQQKQFDSIKPDESLKYKTNAGRTVYGGGGIMPDVFIPRESIKRTSFFNQLVNKGLIYQFAFDYADNNREKLNKYENAGEFINRFNVNEPIFKKFIDFINETGVESNKSDIEKSESLIKNHLKAYIGRNIYGNEAFFPVFHKKDSTLKEAIKLFQSNDYKTYLQPKSDKD